MRAYEMIYILNPTIEEEKTNAVIEKFKNIVENNGGEITKLDKWGKKRLAYEIAKHNDGFYVLCNYNGEPEVTHELDRVLKITDEVIKHLIIRVEE